MAIEIADLPIKEGVFPQFFVCLPEGIPFIQMSAVAGGQLWRRFGASDLRGNRLPHRRACATQAVAKRSTEPPGPVGDNGDLTVHGFNYERYDINGTHWRSLINDGWLMNVDD